MIVFTEGKEVRGRLDELQSGRFPIFADLHAAARNALQSVNLRRPAILRYASSCLPDFAGWSRYPLGIETRGAVLPTAGR